MVPETETSAPARGRAATVGALFSALTVGAVLLVAHGTSSVAAARSVATGGEDKTSSFAAFTGADDNDYPSEIDDQYHKGCPGFENSAVFTSTSCDDTDDGFCSEVKNDWCNGTMCEVFNVSGCSTCDGQFGACVMDALNFLPKICNMAGYSPATSPKRRLSEGGSAGILSQQREAARVIIARDAAAAL